jgi:hypothetical protein
VSIGFIGLLMLAIYLKLRQMEAAEALAKARDAGPAASTEQTFFPRGAILFFGILVVFYAALWLIIYWLMIARS